MTIATWKRMRSGDWKLAIQGERWAGAFVWKTIHGNYAYDGRGRTLYAARRIDAMVRAREVWEQRRASR